jgi:16S rRNA (uracil1498-N3)-methyltransferase
VDVPRDRFFVEGRHAVGDVVRLASDDAHKIVDVLRKSDGDRVTIVDSAAQSFVGRVAVERDGVGARLEGKLDTDGVETSRTIVLAQAIPKGRKMDLIVEKATELGIASIVPLESSRAIAGASAHKVERWRKIARSAAQQSGRVHMPGIEAPIPFAAFLERVADFDGALIAWELATEPLREAMSALRGASTLCIIVGPEGGFSHEEAEAAVRAGAKSVSLGRRILRTETAPLVLLSAILYELGEL